MNGWRKFKLWLHKVGHWEYWPVWIVYLPCFLIYPIYVIRSRSFLFFTAANPGMDNGGAYLVSKKKIYDLLPPQLVPATLLVSQPTDESKGRDWQRTRGLNYPFIAKPDMGLRGDGLMVIKEATSWQEFFSGLNQDYILQEYVPYEKELGIFLIRQESGEFEITSIVEREFMAIVGDGVSTVQHLILRTPRFAMQHDKLQLRFGEDFARVLSVGETLHFDRIGNHSKGTKFKNGNHLITPALNRVINDTMASLSGFNYGRLDIKYASMEELLEGTHFSIIELNGAFSEPAHIYDPRYPLLKAWRDLLRHFSELYRVSVDSITKGTVPPSLSEGLRQISEQLRMTKEYR